MRCGMVCHAPARRPHVRRLPLRLLDRLDLVECLNQPLFLDSDHVKEYLVDETEINGEITVDLD